MNHGRNRSRTSRAELKLDLLCLGARWTEAGKAGRERGRGLRRTRAGLGSGVELVIGPDTWVNVPVVEPFAARSPYELVVEDDGLVDVRRDGSHVAEARLAPRPAWYDRRTPSGRPMHRIATMQGTVLAVYAGSVCEFWVRSEHRPARENCRFCSVGLNLGADDDPAKTEEEILATVHAARREHPLAYVDFNCGHADDALHLDRLLPVVARVKRETGLLVGVQTPPHPDRARWAALRAAGVNRVSFCFELFDPERFREVCPGKHRVHGQRAYLDAVETCLALGREGPRGEPWVVNGEMVAGLEPPAATIAGIDWLVARGAVPTVCVFRPLVGTDLAHVAPPRPEVVRPVFAALYERCVAAGLPVGAAHDVRPSLVLLAEECRDLVDDPAVRRRLRPAERRLALRRGVLRAALAARRVASAALRAPRGPRVPGHPTAR